MFKSLKRFSLVVIVTVSAGMLLPSIGVTQQEKERVISNHQKRMGSTIQKAGPLESAAFPSQRGLPDLPAADMAFAQELQAVAANKNEKVQNNGRQLTYREQLRGEFNQELGISGTGKTSQKWSLANVVHWLQYHPARYLVDPRDGALIEDRRGKPELVFNDFGGFWFKYGNALGKFNEITEFAGTIFNPPLRSFTFNDGTDVVIVAEDNPANYLHGIKVVKPRLRGPVPDFAEDLLALMDIVDTDGFVSQDEFVDYMYNKRA